MSKTGKIIGGLAIALIAAVALVAVLVFQNLDGIIKRIIEDVGSDVTSTRVSVAEVKFTLSEGRGEIRGLHIGNPPGYSGRNLFEMDQVAVQLDTASLTGPVIVIEEVVIDGARLSAEQKGTATNLQDLLDGMDTGASTTEPVPATSDTADVRLMLENFSFTNSSATLKTQQFGDKTLKLPDLKLSGLGDRQTGLTPEQLASKMVSSLVKQAEKAVADYLKKLGKDAAKKELNKQVDDKIGSENREKLEGLKGMFKKDK
ncbi:MAG: hypothetical protein ABJ322_07320 [Marinobacter sp.]|uniref:DUF748 domain-containing protein n=1 Tax=Marinobacter sp. TaxID=50741 RepID=UPI003297604D